MSKTVNVRVHFERPESWTGLVRVPDDFDEMDYDDQRDLVEERVKEYREIWVEDWDYA